MEDCTLQPPPHVKTIFDRLSKLFASSPDNAAEQLTEDDIVIYSGIKCGSTWVQQILHGLRTGGSMEYDDINAVIPALGLTPDVADAERDRYKPFMGKTHVVYDKCPRNGKKIVLTRNPADAALSLYYYLRNWVFEDGELTMDAFVEWFFVQKSPDELRITNAYQMRQLASWYPNRNDENVLWLHYEDLKADLHLCIQMISDFIGIGIGDVELLDLVERQASFDFMKKHASKFDTHKFKLERNEIAGLPRLAGLTSDNPGKVRSGKVNESKEAFSTESLEKLRSVWNERLKPVTGFDSYEEMRTSVNTKLGRSFT